jgi:drug/metabolite transporter (DMT)-like permease
MGATIYLGALIAPLLYACCNHIDKILLERYFKDDGVETLMVISALLSILIVPFVLFMDQTVLEAGLFEIGVLAFVGVLNLILLWAYLKAMSEEEPTVVIIFYSLTSVAGLILGRLILGETISLWQGVAMGIIIMGSLIMTLATDEDGKIKVKPKTLIFMVIASFCWALESTLFKWVALEENVYRSLFWESLTMTLCGLLMLIFIPSWRKSFVGMVKVHTAPILSLNVLNEGLYVVGNAAASFMVVLIPVAINLLMNSFQPIFVFIAGLLINAIIPNVKTEASLSRWQQKLIAIVLTGVGMYILSTS